MFSRLRFAFFLFLAMVLAWASPTVRSNAGVISVDQFLPTTTDGQLDIFEFGLLPASDGLGGLFSITLQGDYSPRSFPPLSEGVTVTFDVAPGELQLYNESGGNGIASNSLTGMSFISAAKAGGGNDTTLTWLFGVDGGLLDSALADNRISVSVQATRDVNPGTTSSPPFVQVYIEYDSAMNMDVPEPSTLTLWSSGLVALIATPRRHRRQRVGVRI